MSRVSPRQIAAMSSHFKPAAFFKCLVVGHEFQNSHSRPGYLTCVRCKFRKRG